MKIKITGGFVEVDEADELLVKSKGWYVKKGYAVRNYKENGKWHTERLHRTILQANPGQCVDHVNRNGLDNRRDNIRTCSHVENCRNTGKRNVSCHSKFKGVSYKEGKWTAQIRINKKLKHLGYFDNEQSAALAYNDAAKNHFFDFAVLNEFAA